MTINLFAFQAEDVAKLKSKRSRLVGNEPGTGKTYVGLALDQANRSADGNSKVDHDSYKNKKTLIVCPKSVISVWDDHCMELTKENVFVIDSKNRNQFLKNALDKRKSGYFICHWDALRLMPELAKVEWFHIVGDEIHRAKNRKAQMTRALWKLPTVYKTGMSGTPADNKPQDLWAILHWLWPNYYTSYWRFVKAYVRMEQTPEGYYKMGGLQEENVEHLKREMEPWFTRRLKQDVLTDLPDKYYSRVWVELDPKQRRAYEQMRKTMVAWAETYQEELERNDPIIAQAAVAQLVRLQQFADGYLIPLLDSDGNQVMKRKKTKDGEYVDKPQFLMVDPSSKLDAIMDLLEDREGEQVVIFSQFKTVINLLAERLTKADISYGLLTGDVSQADRARNVQDFQNGKIRVFAGTIAAGGVGITLTAASTMVFIDRSWSPAINSQAEDRCHRIGQKEAVEIIDLMARNTVDLGKHQQLATKWKWLRMILGDKVETDQIITELNLSNVIEDIPTEEE